MYGRGKKLSKAKTQKQSKENIINSIRNPFILKKEKTEIEYRIIRCIRTLFEEEEGKKEKKKLKKKSLEILGQFLKKKKININQKSN